MARESGTVIARLATSTLLAVVLLGGCASLPPDQRGARPATGPAVHAVILFIGDGADGAPPWAGSAGEETSSSSFGHFPARTVLPISDLQPLDSAGAASAILTGVETRSSSLALDGVPNRGQCAEAAGHEASTLLEQAKAAGLATGIVTTGRVTAAVPAAGYAHLSDDAWEVDAVMPDTATREGCRDIALQLAELQGGPDVVLGGGRLAFLTPYRSDPRDPARRGVRRGGQDLIATWLHNNNGRYLTDGRQLSAIDWDLYKGPVLGLFAPDRMALETDRAATDEPSLTEMTLAAVKALRRNRGGYVLLVDAAGVRRAHRDGLGASAQGEAAELTQAVSGAAELATGALIVVVTNSGGGAAPGHVAVYARGPGAQGVPGALKLRDLYAIMRRAAPGPAEPTGRPRPAAPPRR
jgi:alkaline phosphatase